MDNLLAAIAAKKAELDQLRGRAPGGTANLDHSQDLELTYTSNAIEGNTLTAVETTMVIEQGMTVAGKPLKDHLEAIDHFDAIRYARGLARQRAQLTEMDMRNLHRLVMLRSMPDIAGRRVGFSPPTQRDGGLKPTLRRSCTRLRERSYCMKTPCWFGPTKAP